MENGGKRYFLKLSGTAATVLFVLLFASCGPGRRGVALSKLTINGKNYNRYIENRSPNNGDGHQVGCLVMREISLNILKIDKDSIVGKVMDSKNKESLIFGQVKLFGNESKEEILVITDSLGQFYSGSQDNLSGIRVEYVGYRTLSIDLTKMKK